MDEKLFNIKYVADQTGLSTHVIRIWERRYSAIEPSRDKNNRRLYSKNDIEKLKLLKIATSHGQSIGEIADFNLEKLRDVYNDQLNKTISTPDINNKLDRDIESIIEKCIIAIEKFDSYELEKIIREASISFGSFKLLTDILSPLMELVGEKWSKGDLNPANEHFASEVVENYLKTIILRTNIQKNAPVMGYDHYFSNYFNSFQKTNMLMK